MSMSFSSADYTNALPLPVASLKYRDIAPTSGVPAQESNSDQLSARADERRSGADFSAGELEARIRKERADAVAQVEQQLRQEYESKLTAVRTEIAAALETFKTQRADYFARVESEVVQLSLAIAAKILHREAQVDPMLIATLVRMAVEKMSEGSGVTVRVSVGRGSEWERYFAAWPNLSHVEVVEDPQVSVQDCVLETELGTAHFGLDAQLKEVERGFFDLLALRPVTR